MQSPNSGKFFKFVVGVIVLLGGALPVSSGWRPCGPSDAREVSSISVYPKDSAVVFVTGNKGSIDEMAAWGTVNGGKTWSPVALGESAADTPDSIVIADSRRATYAIRGIDLFEARRGTHGWTRLGVIRDPRFQLDHMYVLSFEATSRVLLAGLGNQIAKQSGGLFRSTNGGRTWAAYPALIGLTIYDILIADDEAKTVFLATQRGVFRTRDAGESWENLGPEGVAARIRDLAIDVRSGSLFAATSGDGIWKSTDGGDSWTARSSGMQSPATYSVEVDPVREGVVWAGLSGGGIYRSTNGGKTWDKSVDGIGTVSVWSIVIPRSKPEQTMIATSGGMYCCSEDS